MQHDNLSLDGGNNKNSMEQVPWRLIQTAPMSGAWNMAIDEAILDSVSDGENPPTLRLYRWNPPCVSLGYSQSPNCVNRLSCKANGVEIVRRPSGGGAVIHHDGVTYSVGVRCDDLGTGRSVKRAYDRLSLGLETAVEKLGVELQIDNKHRNNCKRPAFCFAVTSEADRVARGRKLIGSAQTRRKDTVLQHGEIPLSLSASLIKDIFGDEGQHAMRTEMTCLEWELGRKVGRVEVETAIVCGFETVTGTKFERHSLSVKEWEMARSIWQSKYKCHTYLDKT